jgi:alkylation response protein AidB-like acyl-CoA dehydrogenase
VDFALTEEQLELRASVAKFVRTTLAGPAAPEGDARFPWPQWRSCAGFGIHGLPIPPRYGGSGADPLTTALAMETLGQEYPDNGLVFAIGAHLCACALPILRFGSPDQRQRYLPGLCDGSLVGAFALTEPEAGSDAAALRTTAVRDGDGWVLDGHKTLITNAPVAHLFVVVATTERDSGLTGLGVFLVEPGQDGIRASAPMPTAGLRSAPLGQLVLDGCRVPASRMLGRPGDGWAVFSTAMAWERTLLLAGALGAMARQLTSATAYARRRQQFGGPIARFQAVAHRLVDMRVRLEAGRLLLYQAAWALGQQRRPALEGSIAKLFISESLVQSSLDSLQTYGGHGYLEQTGAEREVRDALASRAYSGTSDIHRNLIAARMGLT